MRRLLTDRETDAALLDLPGWRREGDSIAKDFDFDEFMGGIRFVNDVARVAEEMDHHPDVAIRYTRVTLRLQTHSEGGVTAMDTKLAKAIERIRA